MDNLVDWILFIWNTTWVLVCKNTVIGSLYKSLFFCAIKNFIFLYGRKGLLFYCIECAEESELLNAKGNLRGAKAAWV